LDIGVLFAAGKFLFEEGGITLLDPDDIFFFSFAIGLAKIEKPVRR